MRSIWSFERRLSGRRDPLARPLDRLLEPGRLDRLQQIVHRVHLERLDGMPVEGGDEDDVRRSAVLDEPVRHLEAVEAGHLDVEEQDVRRQALDDADRLEAVAGLRDHLDVAHLLEHVTQLFPRELLVVDDDGF